jgi:hypothetical protein
MAKTRNKAIDDSLNPETTLSGRTSLYISKIDVYIHSSHPDYYNRARSQLNHFNEVKPIKKLFVYSSRYESFYIFKSKYDQKIKYQIISKEIDN